MHCRLDTGLGPMATAFSWKMISPSWKSRSAFKYLASNKIQQAFVYLVLKPTVVVVSAELGSVVRPKTRTAIFMSYQTSPMSVLGSVRQTLAELFGFGRTPKLGVGLCTTFVVIVGKNFGISSAQTYLPTPSEDLMANSKQLPLSGSWCIF